MKIFDRIREQKLIDVAEAKGRVPLDAIMAAQAGLPPARGFARALRGGRTAATPRAAGRLPRVIAEVKKASPSVGVIRPDFDPVAIARSYEAGGAAAISCLTDATFFQGSLDYLKAIRAAVGLPILRKEFMLDPYQVWEARAAGADAILLIAGFVEWPLLGALRATAHEAGLDVLMEIHAEEELAPALALSPDVLGVNNRNLRDEGFVTDLAMTERVAPRVPHAVTFISESGIRDRADVERLAKSGIDAILIGEYLMREPDPGAAIASKLGLGQGHSSAF